VRLARAGALAVAAVLWAPAGAAAQPPAPQPVLVLPFENLAREPRLAWLVEGAALLTTDALAARGVPVFGRDERLGAFERLQVPPIPSLSRASVIRLGEVVGAGSVVVGSVDLAGEEFEVRARRIHLETGRMDPEVVERGSVDDLFDLFDRLAPRVVPDAPDARAAPPPAPRAHPSPEVYQRYVRGLTAEDAAARLSHLEAALEADPAFDDVRFALWDLHTDGGDDARALAAVLEVAESSPRRRDAQFRATRSEIALERYDLAFNRLRALDRDAASAAIANNLGIVQLRRGTSDGGRATGFFERAVWADPEEADPIFNLGYAYWIAQDLNAATYWLYQAVKRNPADGEAHAALAGVLEASGATTEAARERALAEQLSSAYGDWAGRRYAAGDPPPRGLERLAAYLDRRPVDDLDLALLESEQRDHRELAQFHLDRARRFVEEARDRDAQAELRRSLYLAPYQAEAHLLLGRLHLRNGRVADAIDALTISVWSEETSAARIGLARARLAAGDAEAARRELSRALELDPDSADAEALREGLDSETRPQTR
jgi:Tfp pilus assembly protein PilF/TolB-like protein